jgi:hypothetical protein
MAVGCGREALEQALGMAPPDLLQSAQGAQVPSLDLTDR